MLVFPSIDQLEHLSSYRDKLRELLITNNPFFIAFTSSPGAPPQSPQQLDYSVYQQYVSSIFPALKLLDGAPVLSLIEFDLPASLSTAAQTALPPVKESFFDSPTHEKMCYGFVSQYFRLYDGNRSSRDLISVYDDHAIFSLSYQPEPKFPNSKYTEQNRNIASLGSSSKLRGTNEVTLLKTSPIAIVNALNNLPTSKHDVNSFVADVVKIPTQNQQFNAAGGLLNITVRGQFLEGGQQTHTKRQTPRHTLAHSMHMHLSLTCSPTFSLSLSLPLFSPRL